MKQKTVYLLLAVIALAGVSSCNNAPKEQHTSFETMTLVKQNIELPMSWSASLEGKNDVKIVPRANGQLMKVCVSEGQKVTKGQTLFLIDNRQQTQTLNVAQADLQAAEAMCNSAKLEYESNKNLYEKKIVSSYMLNTALNDYNMAKASVAQAKAAVENAKLDLSYCTIASPVNGLVGSIPNNAGDLVSFEDVLTTISGTSEVNAKFSLTETQVQEVIRETGSLEKALADLPSMTLTLKDGTVYPHEGKLSTLAGIVDKNTGSVICKAVFPNPDGYLYSGIQGTVSMKFMYNDVIVVPLTALVRLQDKTLVYRVKDNCAESVIVEVEELENGKDAVIMSGIDAGEVIVALGASNVYDGMQVIFPESPEKSEK